MDALTGTLSDQKQNEDESNELLDTNKNVNPETTVNANSVLLKPEQHYRHIGDVVVVNDFEEILFLHSSMKNPSFFDKIYPNVLIEAIQRPVLRNDFPHYPIYTLKINGKSDDEGQMIAFHNVIGFDHELTPSPNYKRKMLGLVNVYHLHYDECLPQLILYFRGQMLSCSMIFESFNTGFIRASKVYQAIAFYLHLPDSMDNLDQTLMNRLRLHFLTIGQFCREDFANFGDNINILRFDSVGSIERLPSDDLINEELATAKAKINKDWEEATCDDLDNQMTTDSEYPDAFDEDDLLVLFGAIVEYSTRSHNYKNFGKRVLQLKELFDL